MAALRRVTLNAFYAAPWAWLAAFGLLLGATILQVGHVPSYGDPDPKQVAGAWPLLWAIYLLLILALMSPLIVAGETVVRLVLKAGLKPRALALYGAGFALFAAIAFADAFGLMNWLRD